MPPRRTKARQSKAQPFAQNSGAERKPKKKPRGRPFTGKDDPRRNNGGVPLEARELKAALMEHGPAIVKHFMKLVKKGNTLATIKAMEWVVGKPRQEVELTGKDGGPVEVKTNTINPRKLTDAQLDYLEQLLADGAAADLGGGESGEGTEEPAPVCP